MIIIILFLVEFAKWMGISLVLTIVIKLLLSLLSNKKIAFFVIFFPVFVAVVATPFLYWKIRFEKFAIRKAELCEVGTYAKIYAEPPKDMVAFQSENPNKYIGYPSSKHWWFFDEFELNSYVIYDRFQKKALDGIEGQWKKLTRVDKGSEQCEVFDRYVEKNNLGPSAIPEQHCIFIEVLENTDRVNFIGEEKTVDVIYHNGPFIISEHNTKVANEKTGEVYIEIQQVLAGFPRFPHNFYAKFVASSKPCVQANRLKVSGIQGPWAKTTIFNQDKVQQLREQGYGVQQ